MSAIPNIQVKSTSTENSKKTFQPAINLEAQLLAQVYALILSWPDPEEKETTGPEHFGEDAEPAGGDAPTLNSDAGVV